ncbi:hypothetical protein EIP91_005853 [Steccherinum ochraceum]|uniref:Uncharacterized protein n=1 Tax=Steccherinum ochraceum TaxID=92696 RepID=A0A4R0RA54_9APHY|nr:hypothetical protein EIP91_010069 [Steccherinum ochraceum]TCD63186.1 hypothetical protein EIP91_005853 [Steccherinum ochraceum]
MVDFEALSLCATFLLEIPDVQAMNFNDMVTACPKERTEPTLMFKTNSLLPCLDTYPPMSPTRVLVPQRVWTPAGLLQPGSSTRFNDHITFDLHDAPAGLGIPVLDMACRGDLGIWMQKADDPIGFLVDVIRVRLIWPGYEHVDFVRAIPVTRKTTFGQLALRVTQTILTYLSEIRTVRPSTASWRVGPGAIQDDHLYLVSLFPVNSNTFQTVLHVRRR